MLISPVAKLSLISATTFSQFFVSHTLLRGRSRESKSAAIFLVSPLICLTLKTNFDDQFDVDNSFSNFYNTLSGFVYKHAPLKTLSKCKLKQFSKPWLSSEKFWISNLRVVSSHPVKSRVCIPYLMATAVWKLKGVCYPYQAPLALQIRSSSKGSLALLRERWFATHMNWPVTLVVNISFRKYARSFVFLRYKGKYHIIHSPQGFSGIIYNTGWGTLPECLKCSLQVMKEWVMMPSYMSVKVR